MFKGTKTGTMRERGVREQEVGTVEEAEESNGNMTATEGTLC